MSSLLPFGRDDLSPASFEKAESLHLRSHWEKPVQERTKPEHFRCSGVQSPVHLCVCNLGLRQNVRGKFFLRKEVDDIDIRSRKLVRTTSTDLADADSLRQAFYTNLGTNNNPTNRQGCLDNYYLLRTYQEKRE